MKIRMALVGFFFLASSCFSQAPDSTFHSFGLFADFDGSFTDYFGIKYRVSDSWSLFARFQLRHDTDDPDPSSNDQSEFLAYGVAFGVERVVFTFRSVSMFLYGSAGYRTSRSTRDYVLSPNMPAVDRTTYRLVELIVGIGGEYLIVPEFSVAVRQYISADFYRSDQQYHTQPNRHDEGSTQQLGTVKATFTFYF